MCLDRRWKAGKNRGLCFIWTVRAGGFHTFAPLGGPFTGDIFRMINVAISQLTTLRWDLPAEVAHLVEHGFDAISIWRPKLSDVGLEAAVSILSRAGIRVSSLQWAGGFTGSDGRSFRESLADAHEAIEAAATLGARVLVVHSGCRGGHTLSHARRLLLQAVEAIAPAAERAGVTLALKPIHALAAPGCSFLTRLCGAVEVVERFDAPVVRLSLDLWQFGHEPQIMEMAARLASVAAVVQVADRIGPPSPDQERLPAGRGGLPLEAIIAALVDGGYVGDFEFDAVGEAVEAVGYEQTLHQTRRVADDWASAVGRCLAAGMPVPGLSFVDPPERDDAGGVALDRTARDARDVGRADQFLSAGFRRSHASSQTVSRG
ncbi:MAG: sugar phosphate isomerase/epimerase [Planctomycetia bacterium]|nr:sugar phosphate isomerase/epimerase [Planctomycetia bacterium]